ncbi:MAG: GNAT family N-acetyltransferase [Candidatus Bathyarchaeia archaeon]
MPECCRFCLYWQTSGELQPKKAKSELERAKLEWLSSVKESFGDCVEIAFLDNVPIGFFQYAFPKHFPRVQDYVSGPPSGDAVFIACLYITSEKHRGKGYGTAMLRHLLKELGERGFMAVETFARVNSANNPSGPLAFYLKNGFKMISQKDDFPLVRLEF